MSAKVHLKDSPEPIVIEAAHMLVANCGAEVQIPRMAFIWDEQEMGENLELNSLRVCRKCLDLEFDHRYIYGIVRGDRESGREAAGG